jgi:hypothetical protein
MIPSSLSELRSALGRLPSAELSLPEPAQTISPWAWLAPAGLGAALGAWLLAASYRYLYGPQDAGLLTPEAASPACIWLGAILGAVGMVAVVAGTVTRSRYLADLHDLLHGEQLEPVRTLGDLGPRLVARVAAFTLRPHPLPPSRTRCRACLREQLLALARHQADLILMLCWSARQDREAPVSATAGWSAAVLEALTALRRLAQQNGEDRKALGLAIEALFQRLQEEGTVWKEVPSGTPFEDPVGHEFAPFGLVQPGQPIEMLQEAIYQGGVLVQKGRVRRLVP